MTMSEIQETGSSASTGTWNTLSSAAYSGGAAKGSGSAGATITFTVSGRAIWLLTATCETGGAFSVTVDGTPTGGGTSFGVGAATRYRVLIPLGRNLVDGAHTVVITAVSAAQVVVDSVLVLTGAQVTPTLGVAAALGDSITAGYGLANQQSGFPARLCDLLGRKLGRPFAIANKGVSGDSLFGVDAAHVGGMYRVSSDLAALSPEVLTVLFGTNDLILNATMAGDFAGHLLSTLQLLEDLFAVSQMAVILCVPTYLTPQGLTCSPGGNQSGYYAGTASDHHRAALELVKVIAALFPWATVAYTYEVLDDLDSMVYPNGAFDGTHLNDGGHSLAAVEVFRAVLERFAKIGRS